MSTLDRAVDALLAPRSNWQSDRRQAIANFHEVIACCNQAIDIWKEYIKSAPQPTDSVALVGWVGADRAKALNDLNHKVRILSNAIAENAEPYYLGSAINLEPHIIEEAYRLLHEGQTGSDIADDAIKKMQARVQWLEGLIRNLSSAGAPKKIAAKSAGQKKKAAKKKTKKKTVKKKPKKKKEVKKKKAKKKKAKKYK